ncbi:pimeloyl-ACP methyl ester carboxylesterase [Staphylococcus epidermidis]|uniref:alpha/beta fold hydrolase n=1 Tax=Staphylococcus epidermidis TaxID=1282 RepID=UPI001931199C|nr:alpha/beta hydrolase [Staphylococcus epidermidis]MBM0848306.1 alpha/beta hydrolase [Staphylococcus epidermidis]
MRYTEKIKGNNSISILEKLLINNNYHWLLERGNDINNPLILFLHGGPGNAQIGWAAEFQKNLEKEFVVINWDQKGSGLSYDINLKSEDMNLNLFLDELEEIVEFLIKKFKKDKIFLVGHSWGAILGINIVSKRPDLFYEYISVCQPVNYQMSDQISYEYVLRKAYKNMEYELAEKLVSKRNNLITDEKEYIKLLRNLINKYNNSKKNSEIFKIMRKRNEYNNNDIINWISGANFSLEHLWKDVKNTDLFKQIVKIETPISFFLSRNDYNTPSSLIEEYYQKLSAPRKNIVYFENSEHNIPFDEYKEFSTKILELKKQ